MATCVRPAGSEDLLQTRRWRAPSRPRPGFVTVLTFCSESIPIGWESQSCGQVHRRISWGRHKGTTPGRSQPPAASPLWPLHLQPRGPAPRTFPASAACAHSPSLPFPPCLCSVRPTYIGPDSPPHDPNPPAVCPSSDPALALSAALSLPALGGAQSSACVSAQCPLSKGVLPPHTAEKSQAQRGSGSHPGSHSSREKHRNSGLGPSNARWSFFVRVITTCGEPRRSSHWGGPGLEKADGGCG